MIGHRVKEIRKEAGLTQEEFAKSIMVSLKQVNRWERGEAHPSDIYIEKLSLIYNVRQEWLETGKGEMHQSNVHIMDLRRIIVFRRKHQMLPEERPGLSEILDEALHYKFVIREEEAEYLAQIEMPAHEKANYLKELGRFRERSIQPAIKFTAEEQQTIQYIRLMTPNEKKAVMDLISTFMTDRIKGGGERDGEKS